MYKKSLKAHERAEKLYGEKLRSRKKVGIKKHQSNGIKCMYHGMCAYKINKLKRKLTRDEKKKLFKQATKSYLDCD